MRRIAIEAIEEFIDYAEGLEIERDRLLDALEAIAGIAQEALAEQKALADRKGETGYGSQIDAFLESEKQKGPGK